MNNEKQKTLEDLVPPLELCKAAREVIGDRTALVWRICKDGSTEVVQRDWLSRNWKNPEELFVFPAPPAPTLAELLEMIEGDASNRLRDYVNFRATECGRWKANDGRNGFVDANPATAALKLLMKVKGAAV